MYLVGQVFVVPCGIFPCNVRTLVVVFGLRCSGSVVVVHELSSPHRMWDLSSLTRDWACVLCTGRQGANHWTIRGSPQPPNEIMDLGIEHTLLITPHSILCLLMEGHNATCEMFLPKSNLNLIKSLNHGLANHILGPDLASCLFLWIKLCWNTVIHLFTEITCNRDHIVLKA